jgi:hypothetical protein
LTGAKSGETDQVIVYGTATKAEFNDFAILVNRAISKAYESGADK